MLGEKERDIDFEGKWKRQKTCKFAPRARAKRICLKGALSIGVASTSDARDFTLGWHASEEHARTARISPSVFFLSSTFFAAPFFLLARARASARKRSVAGRICSKIRARKDDGWQIMHVDRMACEAIYIRSVLCKWVGEGPGAKATDHNNTLQRAPTYPHLQNPTRTIIPFINLACYFLNLL